MKAESPREGSEGSSDRGFFSNSASRGQHFLTRKPSMKDDSRRSGGRRPGIQPRNVGRVREGGCFGIKELRNKFPEAGNQSSSQGGWFFQSREAGNQPWKMVFPRRGPRRELETDHRVPSRFALADLAGSREPTIVLGFALAGFPFFGLAGKLKPTI